MRKLNFMWLDVFSERPLQGNQLAVFIDAGDLNGEQMQAIAREMNLSETTFVTGVRKEQDNSLSFDVRIFTTEEELPFAGHPSLGTAFALRSIHGLDEVVLNLKVGRIPVSFRLEDEEIFGEMTQNVPEFGKVHDRNEIAAALGVKESDLDDSAPIQTVSTGNPFIMVPFRSLETLQGIMPDFSRMNAYLEKSDAKFMYLVCRETVNSDSCLHARMIFYGGEDPATGSAAGPATAWMLKHGLLEPERSVFIEQGLEIARPSRISVRGSMANGEPTNIRVGGRCFTVGSGVLEL